MNKCICYLRFDAFSIQKLQNDPYLELELVASGEPVRLALVLRDDLEDLLDY